MQPGSFVIVLTLAHAAPDLALKVLEDVPAEEGRWRVELINGGRPTGPMTVCTDAFVDMKKRMWTGVDESEVKGCEPKVVANTSKKAEVTVECGGVSSRLVFLKKGKADFELRYHQEEKQPTMVARYAYVGPCKEGGPELEMDADSPMCRQLRAQIQQMGPALCATVEGAARTECESQIAEAQKRFAEMCGES
ncbi:MAG: hypothetical protein AAFZ18_27715 [Myxococcota bacterium]